MLWKPLSFGAVLLLNTATASPPFQEKCLAFQPTSHVHNSTLRLHEYLPATTNITLQGMHPTCSRTSQVVPIEACRLTLEIPTSNRSSFIFELFLPNDDAYANRYLATGNGGIDGCIKYEDIAYGLSHGFAVTGTNNGHNGTGGEEFLHNPDIVLDFSYRALHTAVDVGKLLIHSFYRKPAEKSYYLGCSGGGRQGMQAADLYPEDFDGLLVGSPALNFDYMSAWRASFFTITGANDSTNFIPAQTWKGLVHGEILKQCDGLDGVEDGVLTDPKICAAIFRPEALLCGCGEGAADVNGTSCLSPQQVEVVKGVFSPLYGTAGQLIYPPLSPGAEGDASARLLSGTPFPYSVDFYRYAVFSDPNWSPALWNIVDADTVQSVNPGNARTWPADLSSLRDRGSKMLIYHGGADGQITHFNTERWYDRLSRSMSSTSEELDEFVRFFRIPGMGHCNGGVGAWSIGQNTAGADGIPFDAKHNVLAALVEWVEKGDAPERVLGTMYNGTTKVVEGRRWHCRYPMRSVSVGGEGEDGEWACRR